MRIHLRVAILFFLPLATFAEEQIQIPDTNPYKDYTCSSPAERQISLEAAIISTLENQWRIKISQETVEAQKGVLQERAGYFDTTLNADYDYGLQNNLQITGLKSMRGGHTNAMDVSLSKEARAGTVTTTGFVVDQIYNPIVSTLYNRSNNFDFFFTIDQPLLRRLWYSPEAAEEKAACYNLKARTGEMIQTIATSIRDTAFAYWDLIFTTELLKIREESRLRLENLAKSTKRLIEEGHIAASEMNQQLGELYREARAQAAAKQDVARTYNDLLFFMGMEQPSPLTQPPPLILDGFPVVDPGKTLCSAEDLNKTASQRRGDFLASLWRIKSTGVLLKSADNNLLPELNLVLGYTFKNNEINRRAKPLFGAANRRLPESDLSAGIVFSYPLCNNEAKGLYKRRAAEREEACLFSRELYEQIRTNILSSFRNHYSLLTQIKDAKESVTWYEKALSDEVRRFQEGFSTLFIVIDFEDRLRRAQTELAETHRVYAQNLTNLYYLTGTLVDYDCRTQCVNISDVRSFDKLLAATETAKTCGVCCGE